VISTGVANVLIHNLFIADPNPIHLDQRPINALDAGGKTGVAWLLG
jgi:hypothetical protein